MSEGKEPKVSIGLAVYNGDKYLRQAIDSILTQTFTDFELIISDNASIDQTEQICRSYAEQDKRIRYHRNDTNIGGANNENLTFKLARGKYFRWAAHDDLCAPTLLEKLVQVLDGDPSVVLAYSHIQKINEDNEKIGLLLQEKGTSSSPYERFKGLTSWDHDCETSYGLIRSEIMAKTDLQLNYTDSDRTLLCELSLYGKFYQVPEVLFYKRIHPEMSTKVYQDWRQRMAWFNPTFSNKQITFPYWQQFSHHFRIISRSPLSTWDKIACYAYMITWVFMNKRWGRLINDLFIAVRKLLIRILNRS